MKADNAVVIILIAGGAIGGYFAIVNWLPQTNSSIPHGISCKSELKQFQSNLELTERQQTESIIMANQTLKKLIDNSSYCEFMGISTGYTGEGTYQNLNINLNDTKELSVLVSLRNNTVVLYELSPLMRLGPAVYVHPFNIVLLILAIGSVLAGIILYFLKVRKVK